MRTAPGLEMDLAWVLLGIMKTFGHLRMYRGHVGGTKSLMSGSQESEVSSTN